MMNPHEIRLALSEKGLKVTPQRTAILEAVLKLKNHPSAENITGYIKKNHPNIATGTVYKTLETLTEKGLLNKVKTGKDIMRYEAVLKHHHHLYCAQTERIEDYEDDKLTSVIMGYFKKKKIKNFKIHDIKLQITGEFYNSNK